MRSDPARRQLRRGYAALLRLYPKTFRERFAEPMEEAFADLLRERARTGRGVTGYACRLYFETSARIVQENAIVIGSHKGIVRLALLTAGLLLVPVFGNRYVDGWNWDAFDFVFAGTLIFGSGLALLLMWQRAPNAAYRLGAGLALATAFLVVWINGAVGIIGDAPVNVLYYGVPLIGIAGALIARLSTKGMSRALFATALAMALVPVIALLAGTTDFSPGVGPVFVLNGVCVAMFAASGLLFRRAHRDTLRP